MKEKVKTQLLLGIFITLAVIILSSGRALAAEASNETELQNALDGTDSTITLTDSFTLTNTKEIGRSVTITGGEDITLNTGGFSLNISPGVHLIVDGDLTITGTKNGTIFLRDDSTFTLLRGNITSDGTDEHCAIDIRRQDSAKIYGGTVNIMGGTVESSGSGAYGAIFAPNGRATLNITDGEIKGNKKAIYLRSSSSANPRNNLTISGGTFSASEYAIEVENGNVTISAITILGNPIPLNLETGSVDISGINSTSRLYMRNCDSIKTTNCTARGIEISDSSNVTLTSCNFTENRNDDPVLCFYNTDNTVIGGNSYISGADTAIFMDNSTINITDDVIIESINYGLYLSGNSKVIVSGNPSISVSYSAFEIISGTVEIECTENLQISAYNILTYNSYSVLNSLPKPIIVAVGEIGRVDVGVDVDEEDEDEFTFGLDIVNTSSELSATKDAEDNSFSVNPTIAGDYNLVLLGTKTGEGSPFLTLVIPVSVEDGSPDANFGISLDKTGTHTFDDIEEGYASVTPLTITINNTGNQSTGDLSVTLSGTNSGDYTLSKTNIDSIAKDGSSTFTVKPNTGLSIGTYVATITISGDSNITSQAFSVSFTVTISDTTPPENNGGGGESSGGKSSSITPGYVYSVNQDTGAASVGLGSLGLGIGETVVNIPAIPGVNNYSLSIGASSLATTDGQGNLTLATDVGNITLPSNMLAGLSDFSGNSVEILIGQGDRSNLPEDIRAAIGDRPIISLALSLDGEQTDWNNPNAPVRVSIPYTPTEAEMANPESIVIWYIDGSGNAVAVPNARYDLVTGTVTFTTSHFSDFAVTYKFVNFNDVADKAWYAKAISFIAARDITLGTGDNNFNPQAKLTRGQFIIMLMRAYEIAPVADPVDNFLDAGNTYYTDYLATAKKLGITEGTGNNMYSPDKNITRQEMFTLLYNILDKLSRLPKEDSQKNLADFTDEGQIASWARDAMTLLVKTGTVSGNQRKLSPLDTSSRAEMAQVLYNLLGN